MFYIYALKSIYSDKLYIGYTNNLQARYRSHKFYSKTKKTKLYDFVRKYNFDSIYMIQLFQSENKEDILEFEKLLIEGLKPELNLASGGEGGFNVIDIESWKEKLRQARKGRKPALGMKHTEETKEILRQQQIKRHEFNRK